MNKNNLFYFLITDNLNLPIKKINNYSIITSFI